MEWKKKSQSEKELYHDLEKGKTTETSNNGWLLRVWEEEGKVEYMKHKEYFMWFVWYYNYGCDTMHLSKHGNLQHKKRENFNACNLKCFLTIGWFNTLIYTLNLHNITRQTYLNTPKKNFYEVGEITGLDVKLYNRTVLQMYETTSLKEVEENVLT